jgi:hypothetical protein
MLQNLMQDPVRYLTADPVGQSVLLPFAVALVVAALLRLAGGSAIGRRTAAFGIGAGFLAAFVFLAEMPAGLSSGTPLGKLFWIAAAGLAMGFVLDLDGSAGRGVAFAAAAAALVWLAAERHEELWRVALLLYAASILVYWRIGAGAESEEPARRSEPPFPPILLLITAGALAWLIPKSAALDLAPLATALASAAGGYLLLAYLFHLLGAKPLRVAASGLFGGAGALLAIGSVWMLFVPGASAIGGGILLLAFLLDHRARALALGAVPGEGVLARALQPLVYALVVAVPAAAAVAYIVFVEARAG